MADVILLDQETANKIAAGEVIERPYAVVKELVENSIDALSTVIEVEVKGGGLDYIRVVDNGTGMSKKNALKALCRHATSKIREAEDLKLVKTLGFRGEALPSIASVSHLRLRTCCSEDISGTEIKVEGGEVIDCLEKGCPIGTEVLVQNLFYNTPARRKFLKSPASEVSKISDIVNRLALSCPGISFSLLCEGRRLLKTWGRGSLPEVISIIYGREKARHFIPVNYIDRNYSVRGFTAKPVLSRSNRSHQTFFINGRFIRSPFLSRPLEDAYGTLLSRNSYPMAVLYIEVDSRKVDINVHPTKIEVRFAEEQILYRFIYDSIQGALKKQNLIPEFHLTGNKSREKLFEQSSFYTSCDDVNRVKITTTNSNNSIKVEKEENAAKAEGSLAGYTDKQAEDSLSDGLLKEGDAITGVTKEEHCVTDPAEQIEHKLSDCIQERERAFSEDLDQGIKDISYKIMNQFLGTYILVQRERDLLLIDQHAAHERVIYDKLKEELNQGIMSQEIIPMILELTSGTEVIIEENRHFWEGLGFKIEPFGNNSYILRSVPLVMKDLCNLNMVEDIIYSFPGERTNLEIAREEILKTMACKAAFKANQKLPREEMETLVKQLFNTKGSYTCPHGRPTMIVITETELEKNFKRRL